MLKTSCFQAATLMVVASLLACPLFAQKSLAIKGGTVMTLAGQPIANATVVIQDGKITAVGENVNIPVDAQVIDASGKIVMPGFVEAHSSEGMSQANETNPNVPYVSVLDTIDPMRNYFDEARRNGVTSVCVVPGNTTMIGGQASVIKTGGTFLDDMILKRQAGIKLSLKPLGSSSRMGHLAALRKELDDATNKAKPTKESDDESNDDADTDADSESESNDEQANTENSQPRGARGGRQASQEPDPALVKLVAGELTAFIYCEKALDVPQALSLVADYNLKPVFILGKDCHKALGQVAKSGFPVVLDSTLVFWERDPRTDEDRRIVLSEALRQHGGKFTFAVARANNNSLGNNYLWYQAATAAKYGMPESDAIEAITKLPASYLGIDRFVGTLEAGKDGDVIILTGDPLRTDTWVETTIVNGQVVYERSKDEKLQRLLDTAEN